MRIAIFTGNRSEYGLLYPIIKAVDAHKDLEYFLIVSGAHTDQEFGNTKEDIERDGIKIHEETAVTFSRTEGIGIDIIEPSDIVYAIAGIMIDLVDIFYFSKPDILLVYGDRYEAFAAVLAASQMGVPVAHIEGGDITQGGVLDDSVRHAITKLSHLHFTTNTEATERILAMGEEKWRVHTVGLPTLDCVKQGYFASPAELFKKYGMRKNRPLILCCQHSINTEPGKAAEQIKPTLEAIKLLAEDGVQCIILYPCNDAGGKLIIREIELLRDTENIQVHKSISSYDYHGILNLCGREGIGVMVGNSSAGIKETPAFGCPAVNIGNRQNGRLTGNNVINTDYKTDEILIAVNNFFNPEIRERYLKGIWNPYGDGTASEKIVEVLTSVSLGDKLMKKKMTY